VALVHECVLQINYALADAPEAKLEYSLKQDMEQAVSVGARLAAAMVEYFVHQQRASDAFNALLLQKSLRQKMWTGTRLETRQLAGVGDVTAERLAAGGVHTLRQLAAVEPRRLESIAQRPYPWGAQVHDALRRCMPPDLELTCTPVAWAPGGLVDICITLTRKEACAHEGGSDALAIPGTLKSYARLLVGSLHDNALLGWRSLVLESFPSPLSFTVRTRSASGRAPLRVVASVVHKTLIGVDVSTKMAWQISPLYRVVYGV